MTDELIIEGLTVRSRDRRHDIHRLGSNGIDAVEVDEGGRRLAITFLEAGAPDIGAANLRIDPPDRQPAVAVRRVFWAAEDDPQLQDRLIVVLDQPGGEGVYRVTVVEPTADGRPGRRPLASLDPGFASAEVRFDVDRPNPIAATTPSTTHPVPSADISYLARDYAGLRQLLLDRLGRTLPEWSERDVPDLLVTLVELLADAGDRLSYEQDAIATEAYLQTARQRISVRRHARLVGYRVHDGGAARTWVHVEVSDDVPLPLDALRFAVADRDAVRRDVVVPTPPAPPSADALIEFIPIGAEPGAPLPAPVLATKVAHNGIDLWSWGESDATLPAGSTSASLVDRGGLGVRPGDVLLFEETVDPTDLGVGDPAHRHVIRVVTSRRTTDELLGQPLVEITWAGADRLPFDLAVSRPGPAGAATACSVVRGNLVAVRHGRPFREVLPNGVTTVPVVDVTWSSPTPDPDLVAHHQADVLRHLYAAWRRQLERWWHWATLGLPLDAEARAALRRTLGPDITDGLGLSCPPDDPDPAADDMARAAHDAWALALVLAAADIVLARRRRRLGVLADLALASGPLETTLVDEVRDDWGAELAERLDARHPSSSGPAGAAMTQDPRTAEPVLTLTEATPPDEAAPRTWTVTPDLLDAGPADRCVVVEVDDDGRAHLRFGPAGAPTTPLTAVGSIGNGSSGNAPAEAINAVIAAPPATTGAELDAPPVAYDRITGVRNPLPATGGIDPEPLADAKRSIPGAYLVDQPRALAADDYAGAATAVDGVRRAAATLRWTGHGYLVDVAVQPISGADPSADLCARVERELGLRRRMGHDVRARGPRYRPVVVELEVTLDPDAVRDDVRTQLEQELGTGRRSDGRAALFHPDRRGFGQAVESSPIVAVVQSVAGVTAVLPTRFEFLDHPGRSTVGIIPERLEIGPMEIAMLDDDPGNPANGYATLVLRGGR